MLRELMGQLLSCSTGFRESVYETSKWHLFPTSELHVFMMRWILPDKRWKWHSLWDLLPEVTASCHFLRRANSPKHRTTWKGTWLNPNFFFNWCSSWHWRSSTGESASAAYSQGVMNVLYGMFTTPLAITAATAPSEKEIRIEPCSFPGSVLRRRIGWTAQVRLCWAAQEHWEGGGEGPFLGERRVERGMDQAQERGRIGGSLLCHMLISTWYYTGLPGFAPARSPIGTAGALLEVTGNISPHPKEISSRFLNCIGCSVGHVAPLASKLGCPWRVCV